MATPQKRSRPSAKFLTLSLDSIDRKALERAARIERLSLSDTMRRAIRSYAASLDEKRIRGTDAP